MWSSFFLACLIGACMLYVPGVLTLKALRFSNATSLLAAPLPSCLLYAVLALVCGMASVPVNGAMLFALACGIGVVLLVASIIVVKQMTHKSVVQLVFGAPFSSDGDNARERRFNVKAILLFLVLGLALGLYICVKPLDGADSFPLLYDDLTHYGLVQGFIESQNYSVLTTTVYPDLDNVGVGYYPALWHQLAAMIATALGISHLIAVNAVNYLITSLVYPLGMLLLFLCVFRKDKRVTIAGGLICLALVAFPWSFLILGRMLANLMGFIFLPIVLAGVYEVFAPHVKRSCRVRGALLVLFGCALAPFAQPNLLFSVVVLSAPYITVRIWRTLGDRPCAHGRLRQWVGTGAFLVAVGIFWAICLDAPFMKSVVDYSWPARTTISQALFDIFFVCSSLTPISPFLAFFLLIGICTTVKERRYRWITATFFLVAVMYVVCAATDSIWDRILTGFWYTDMFRVSAMLAIIETPLIALGLARSYRFIAERARMRKPTTALMTAALLLVLLFPSFMVPSVIFVDMPFGHLRHVIADIHRADTNDDEALFSQEERAFVDEAKAITGDALVFNTPYDGSMFAYQYNGMHTYQRLRAPERSVEEAILNQRLRDYGIDKEVRQAAESLGVEYVIMLDSGHEPYTELWPEYRPERWSGFEGITDDTPGFEVVLAKDDMRFYRLVPTD